MIALHLQPSLAFPPFLPYLTQRVFLNRGFLIPHNTQAVKLFQHFLLNGSFQIKTWCEDCSSIAHYNYYGRGAFKSVKKGIAVQCILTGGTRGTSKQSYPYTTTPHFL